MSKIFWVAFALYNLWFGFVRWASSSLAEYGYPNDLELGLIFWMLYAVFNVLIFIDLVRILGRFQILNFCSKTAIFVSFNLFILAGTLSG